jgi:hypothetical protein
MSDGDPWDIQSTEDWVNWLNNFQWPHPDLNHTAEFYDVDGDEYRSLWTQEHGWFTAMYDRIDNEEWINADIDDYAYNYGPYSAPHEVDYDTFPKLLNAVSAPWEKALNDVTSDQPLLDEMTPILDESSVRLTPTWIHDLETKRAEEARQDMASFNGGGVRSSDEGKPKFRYLLAPDMPVDKQILARIANRMEAGAKQYGENNYGRMCTEDALSRARDSLMRHVVQYINGDTDEDHLAAVGCNILMISKIEHNIANGRGRRMSEHINDMLAGSDDNHFNDMLAGSDDNP